MTRTMMSTLLALALIAAANAEAAANAQDSETYWSKQVDSDKQALSGAISSMESAASMYRQAVQNHTHAKALSQALSETAYSAAHKAAQKDRDSATSDFNTALASLKSATVTGRKDAEKAARQKSRQVDAVYRQEGNDARSKLKSLRADASKKVFDAYDQTKAAARKLKQDGSSLEKAMRKNGRSEREYESMADHLEHLREGQSDHAEDTRDRAADAVEHIYESAQDHLNDRVEHQKERASDDRDRAIEETLAALDSQQAAAKSQQAATKKQQLAQASPVASALNLYAKTDASASSKEQQYQMEEQTAQSDVDADKSKLSTAMQHLDLVTKEMKLSVKNATQAKALAAKIAQDVYDDAATKSKAEKAKATTDFNTYLDALKSATPTANWKAAVKTVTEQAHYLDRLDKQEEKEAREMLRRKHDTQKKSFLDTYHGAHQAAKNLLKDKDHLENAMRHAGKKEREYEGQEERNEALGERNEDRSEDLRDDASDAAEEMYERASDSLDKLQHANHKEQHKASRLRHQQIRDAVMTLKDAAKDAAKDATKAKKELLVSPVDFNSSCLLAVASVGVLLSFYVRRARPSPVAPPLLG